MKKSILLITLIPDIAAAFCFDEAGKFYNVSPHLLRSIAKVESSLKPKAYNENKNKNGIVTSRDYGLMQINSTHFAKLKKFNIDASNIYDPCLNVYLGAWVLSSNFASHGYNWNSVGAYNAGFRKEAQKAREVYIEKVKSKYYAETSK